MTHHYNAIRYIHENCDHSWRNIIGRIPQAVEHFPKCYGASHRGAAEGHQRDCARQTLDYSSHVHPLWRFLRPIRYFLAWHPSGMRLPRSGPQTQTASFLHPTSDLARCHRLIKNSSSFVSFAAHSAYPQVSQRNIYIPVHRLVSSFRALDDILFTVLISATAIAVKNGKLVKSFTSSDTKIHKSIHVVFLCNSFLRKNLRL